MRPSRAIAIASLSALFLSLSAGSTTASQTTSPLPGGVVRMPGLQAAASIVRDSNGLAHIHAGNRHDLYFLQGWVHAQDRLFQMDVSRRTTDGTLAELLGTSALPQDVQLRTIGLHRAAERSWQAYSVDTRVALDAYTDGVNAFVAANPLPREYTALNLTSFRAWRPQDTVGIGKLIAFGLSFDLDIDLTRATCAMSAPARHSASTATPCSSTTSTRPGRSAPPRRCRMPRQRPRRPPRASEHTPARRWRRTTSFNG